MQKNYIKEETIERMRLDEEVLMDFFREYLSVSVSADLCFLHFVKDISILTRYFPFIGGIYFYFSLLRLFHSGFMNLATES